MANCEEESVTKPYKQPPINTSQFYKTHNLPERFECPCKLIPIIRQFILLIFI